MASDERGDDYDLSEKLQNQLSLEDELLFKSSKLDNIRKSLKRNDLLSLKAHSITIDGFINNELRAQVWSKLLDKESRIRLCEPPETECIADDFARIVTMDVDRSLKRFPPSVSEAKRISYQDSLTKMIIKVLKNNPSLHYYQGYHDICLTLLLVMDEKQAYQLTNQISNLHLKYFMEKTMNTTSNLLEIIYLILKEESQQLYDYLIRSEVGTIFSLSWVITWFSHVLNDLDDILRLFDFFIANHFLTPIYLTVAILLYKEDDILQIECDMASMHKYLSSIPETEQLPFENLIQQSLKLLVHYPPEKTLEEQKEMQQEALKGDTKLIYKSYHFLRQNIFSLTFFGLFTAMVFQIYNDYKPF